MGRKIKFNTGRGYSAEGQIIEAEEFGSFEKAEETIWTEEPEDQYVVFHDLTRMIKGKIPFCPLDETSIMRNYDKGNYQEA